MLSPAAMSPAGPSRSRHLRRLEAESIAILREVAAEFRNPVLMYSIGKDSSVLLHLARKAFYPAKPPFPLLHIDTTWKFREMIAFRDATARALGLDLIVHTNQDGLARGINPIASGSALHTEMMKTEALETGARQIRVRRRDRRRAARRGKKPRQGTGVFAAAAPAMAGSRGGSVRNSGRLFNTRLAPGETMRVFPLSNWTELDVWDYIEAEKIPVVPLYFAQAAAGRRRATASGSWSMTTGCRCVRARRRELRMVRFRTLGCYPLTGAIESAAATVADIVAELRRARTSERQGRLIDTDDAASMERKKKQGYF